MVRPAVTLPGELGIEKQERAGPLDTEMAKRPGGGSKASLLRSKWRLCLSLALPGDLRAMNGLATD